MIIGMYFDEHGVFTLDLTPEDEMAEAKEFCNRVIPGGPHIYREDLRPFQIKQEKLDAYILDVGGLCLFGSDIGYRYTQTMAEQVADKPDTLFILWSSFTCSWYWDIVEHEMPELMKAPNVVMRYHEKYGNADEAFETRVRKWFEMGR